MLKNPKMNEKAIASKQTTNSFPIVNLIAFKMLDSNSILAKMYNRTKEYSLI
jgi:hypothetical protein